jgi:hypothetical protein
MIPSKLLRYELVIKQVLKQVHPDTMISKFSIIFLESCFYNLLSYYNHNSVEEFLDEYLINDINKHAMAEISKAKINNETTVTQIKYCKKNILKVCENIKQDDLINLIVLFEYLLAEILELAGDVARDYGLVKINIFHIVLCIRRDEELNHLFPNLMFPSYEKININFNIKTHCYQADFFDCTCLINAVLLEISEKYISKSAIQFIKLCMGSLLDWFVSFHNEKNTFEMFINKFFDEDLAKKLYNSINVEKNENFHLKCCEKKVKSIFKNKINIETISLLNISKTIYYLITHIFKEVHLIAGKKIETYHIILVLKQNNLLHLLFSLNEINKINLNTSIKSTSKHTCINNELIITI